MGPRLAERAGRAHPGLALTAAACRSRLRPLALAAGLLLASAGCLAQGPVLAPPPVGEPAVTVHVVGHGWHVGLALRREEIPEASWPEHAHFPPAAFLEVGWGDRAFYETPDAGAWLAVRAAVASEQSVLHVTGLARAPAEAWPGAEIVTLRLSPGQAAALARFVSAAYARDAAGEPVDLGPGLFPLSRFYAATGRYSAFYTCNRWVADALLAAGCPMTPARALTAGAALRQARQCQPP